MTSIFRLGTGSRPRSVRGAALAVALLVAGTGSVAAAASASAVKPHHGKLYDFTYDLL